MIEFIYYAIKNQFRQMDVPEEKRKHKTIVSFYNGEVRIHLPDNASFYSVRSDWPRLYHMWVSFERKLHVREKSE